jgi:hypothetical protein
MLGAFVTRLLGAAPTVAGPANARWAKIKVPDGGDAVNKREDLQQQTQRQYVDVPREDEGEMLTAEEASAYLGVDAKQLPALAEQYGLPRRYIVEPRAAWVYDSADLDRVKAVLPAAKQAAAADPAAVPEEKPPA